MNLNASFLDKFFKETIFGQHAYHVPVLPNWTLKSNVIHKPSNCRDPPQFFFIIDSKDVAIDWYLKLLVHIWGIGFLNIFNSSLKKSLEHSPRWFSSTPYNQPFLSLRNPCLHAHCHKGQTAKENEKLTPEPQIKSKISSGVISFSCLLKWLRASVVIIRCLDYINKPRLLRFVMLIESSLW